MSDPNPNLLLSISTVVHPIEPISLPTFPPQTRHHRRSRSFSRSPSDPRLSTYLETLTGQQDPNVDSLPTYTEFLAMLHYPNLDTLPPEAECPICHIPYTGTGTNPENNPSMPSLAQPIPLNQQATSPSKVDTHNERPVRIPCPAGHIFGEICIHTWFTNARGDTCPLDRSLLFSSPQNLFRQRSLTIQYHNGRRAIDNASLGSLIERSSSFASSDIVNISSGSMNGRLANLFFRIALHLGRTREGAVSTPVIVYEDETRSVRNRWPQLTMQVEYGVEARAFTRFVRMNLDHVPSTGRREGYLLTIMLLLHSALPHLFTILYRLAQVYQGHTMPATEFTTILQMRVTEFFRDYPEYTGEVHEVRLRSLITTVVNVWVAQELLMTSLRSVTQTLNLTTDANTLETFLVGYPRNSPNPLLVPSSSRTYGQVHGGRSGRGIWARLSQILRPPFRGRRQED
jgi:hypothetical protein